MLKRMTEDVKALQGMNKELIKANTRDNLEREGTTKNG